MLHAEHVIYENSLSLPGMTMRFIMNPLKREEGEFFSLFSEKDSDLHDLVTVNTAGGASIVFHREQIAGVTEIREGGKKCALIDGEDANALYLWAIAQEMPTGWYSGGYIRNKNFSSVV